MVLEKRFSHKDKKITKMALMQNDFSYLARIFDEFFSCRHVNNRLSLIYQSEISGWEAWLQIELAHFLITHSSEPEWYREIPLQFDRRSESEKSYFRPDFIIRKKYWPIATYVAVEIKQHPIPASCIRNMFSDICKVSKMRMSQLNMRSLWALGVFKTDKELNLDELVDNYVGDSASFSKCELIGRTGFAYLLYGKRAVG